MKGNKPLISPIALSLISGLFLSVLSITESITAQSSCSDKEISDHIALLAKADPVAFDALVKCKAKAVNALTKAINNPDETIQITAIAALGEIGQDATPVISPLLEQIRNENKDIRAVTWSTLIRVLESDRAELISIAILTLKSSDADIRSSATDALGRIGKDAVPALIIALRDSAWDVRSNAAAALGKIGKDAVPALIIALKGSAWDVRSNAADALGRIGKDAKDAVPALIIALKEDSDKNVRSRSAYTLGSIGRDAKDAVPALIIALKDSDLDVRLTAAYALGQIGKEANNAIPVLIEMIRSSDIKSVAFAAEALYLIIGLNEAQKIISEKEFDRIKTEFERVTDRSQTQYLPRFAQLIKRSSTSTVSEATTYSIASSPPLVCYIPILDQVLYWKCR